jgi:pimeloyl-ACP methyl ester carboxylesterase
VAALRHAPRRTAATALLVLGLAGVIAGIGIGGPHLVKVGLTFTTVAGVVALLAGLAAVWLALGRFLRGGRWWWKAATAPAALAVGLLLVTPLTVAVMMTNSPPLELGDATPADFGLPYEDVQLRTADGEQLAAWYVPSRSGSSVILLGGSGSTRDDEVDVAAALARHGLGVLLLDVRGHGGSTGEANLLGWYGEVDVPPAVDYLTTRPDVVDGRIGVLGLSMGGQQAVAAAGADLRIRAVVADGVVGRHGRELQASDPVDWLMGRIAMQAVELMSGAPDPTPLVDAVRAAGDHPFLVIAAGEQGVEQDFADRLVAASPSTVEVWVAPDTGHTQAFSVHPAEWSARDTGFFERSLTAA